MQNVLQRTGRSFRDIYEEHLPMVYRIAFTYMKNSYDSEDAAHETFLRLMKCEKLFKDREHVKAWLIVTVTNVCRDMLRRRYRNDLSIDESALGVAADTEHSELLEAVMELPETYKTVVYMYYYEGYAVKEIAKMLNKPEGTVKSWLNRARQHLKDYLGGRADDRHEVC